VHCGAIIALGAAGCAQCWPVRDQPTVAHVDERSASTIVMPRWVGAATQTVAAIDKQRVSTIDGDQLSIHVRERA